MIVKAGCFWPASHAILSIPVWVRSVRAPGPTTIVVSGLVRATRRRRVFRSMTGHPVAAEAAWAGSVSSRRHPHGPIWTIRELSLTSAVVDQGGVRPQKDDPAPKAWQ